ncbi:hypothetical protein [Streptomyces violaceorubidus]|uniref:hypothetical protein n=1 Tax=Streptomyces violaceorubidus TaxID=284042 RepID=UPI003D9E5BFF
MTGTLTPAGEALLHHGRHALDAVGAAAEKARRAGDRQARLRLVIKPGGDANLLSGILAAYAGRPDARQADILFGGATDRADHVRDGRADVALLYVPFDDLTGLETTKPWRSKDVSRACRARWPGPCTPTSSTGP